MRVYSIAAVLRCGVTRFRHCDCAVLRCYLLAALRHSVCAAIATWRNTAIRNYGIAAISWSWEAPAVMLLKNPYGQIFRTRALFMC